MNTSLRFFPYSRATRFCRGRFFITLLSAFLLYGSLPERTFATEEITGTTFSLYVLSRGRGVPDNAYRVLQSVQDLFSSLKEQGEAVNIIETVIGLEGERRLCAEFIDRSAAQNAWHQVRLLADGIDLVNLRAEPCTP